MKYIFIMFKLYTQGNGNMWHTTRSLCSYPLCFNKSVQNLAVWLTPGNVTHHGAVLLYLPDSAVFHPPRLVRCEQVSMWYLLSTHKEELFFYSGCLLKVRSPWPSVKDGSGRHIYQHHLDSLLLRPWERDLWVTVDCPGLLSRVYNHRVNSSEALPVPTHTPS
jgi:hypothetical protein